MTTASQPAAAPDTAPAATRPAPGASLTLALAQVNATLGDFAANAALVFDYVDRAAARGVDLVAFPEMVLTGYPVEDLALRGSFVRASQQTLAEVAATLAERGHGALPVVVGYLDANAEGRPQNCAAVLREGRVETTYVKHHLPNYGVFDEFRIFASGSEARTFDVRGHTVALAICEDLWQDGGPVAQTRELGADLLLVLNGSPYERDKDDLRLSLCQRRAAEAGCPLAYVNLVGAQDDLVFDGDSLVVDAAGTMLARAQQFHEELLVVDLAATPSAPAARLDDTAEVYQALVVGLRDYVVKNGFSSVVLGLSGGIDSALVAAIAADAIGGENVYGVSMPSMYSSEHSKDDARDSAERIGLNYQVQPIAGLVTPFVEQLGLTGVSEENVQARCRGVILMGLSNQHGHLVLATGNKTELAVGYSTIYGDAVGGYAPIKDCPKTLVWDLARHRNRLAEAEGKTAPIPENSITKPPSAELRPGQVDQDSLPPYPELDAVLEGYVTHAQGRDELIAAGHDAECVDLVLRLVDRAEWKRRQYPPGPKVSAIAFGRDRRLPITSRWREQLHRK
ncbi:NAD+ synthase [Micrococcales bacterium 31B]|nr:NAD+ synthase [Micrococcales bacterium 31B]